MPFFQPTGPDYDLYLLLLGRAASKRAVPKLRQRPLRYYDVDAGGNASERQITPSRGPRAWKMVLQRALDPLVERLAP